MLGCGRLGMRQYMASTAGGCRAIPNSSIACGYGVQEQQLSIDPCLSESAVRMATSRCGHHVHLTIDVHASATHKLRRASLMLTHEGAHRLRSKYWAAKLMQHICAYAAGLRMSAAQLLRLVVPHWAQSRHRGRLQAVRDSSSASCAALVWWYTAAGPSQPVG